MEADGNEAVERGWQGLQSLPREINIDKERNDGSITMMPVDEIKQLRTLNWNWENVIINGAEKFELKGVGWLTGKQMEIRYQVEIEEAQLGGITSYGIELRSSGDGREYTRIQYVNELGPYIGIDHPTNDYDSFASQNWQDCRQICQGNSSGDLCQAWAWCSYAGVGKCWLKAPIPGPNPNKACVSGIRERIIVNRTMSSLSQYADNSIEGGPVVVGAGGKSGVRQRRLDVWLDHSVIEVFSNMGRGRIASRVYPTLEESVHVYLFVEGTGSVNVTRVDVWGMKSIW